MAVKIVLLFHFRFLFKPYFKTCLFYTFALIEYFYKDGKTVAAVCHALAIFKHTKNEDGSPLVKGKKVTGFTNTEEDAVQLTDVVPFLVEDMLKENGGIYSKKVKLGSLCF